MSGYRLNILQRCSLFLLYAGSVSTACHPKPRQELHPTNQALETLCQDFLKQRENQAHLETRNWPDRKRCFPFHEGFFALAIKNDKREEDSYRIDWDILWVKDGRAEIVEPTAAGAQQYTLNLQDSYRPGDDRSGIFIEAVQDIDGDGAAELFLTEQVDVYEDLNETTPSIWTVRGRQLIRYAHDPSQTERNAVAEELLKDVDGDGRLDIFTSGGYGNSREPVCGNIDDAPAIRPIFLHHALPDGRFSKSDAVAQAALRQCCPRRPDLKALVAAAVADKDKNLGGAPQLRECAQISPDAPYDLLRYFSHAIMCARAWGETTQSVLQTIKPACFAAPDGCIDSDAPPKKECPDWVAKLAAVKPDILLH